MGMSKTTYGNRYAETKHLSTTEVAKEIRKDIKALINLGALPPGLKASVKTRYFAGGSSIDVTVTHLPATLPVYNPEWLVADDRGENTYAQGLSRHSNQVKNILNIIEGAVESYNFDGSDSMTDYFHVRFYGSVKLDWALEADRKNPELVDALTDHLEHQAEIQRAAVVEAFALSLYNLVRYCEAFDAAVADYTPEFPEPRDHKRDFPVHSDISRQYGCPATLTSAAFEAHGILHVARRLYRSDLPTSGKIELYTVEPGTTTEDFFRYVNEFEPSKVDIQAIAAIKAADPTYATPPAFDFVQRVSLLELA